MSSRNETKSATAPASGGARYIGRVGALAVALGVGSAIAAMPSAFADSPGSDGSAGSDPASSRSSASPQRDRDRSSASSARAGKAATAPKQGRASESGADRAGETTPRAGASDPDTPKKVGSALTSWLGVPAEADIPVPAAAIVDTESVARAYVTVTSPNASATGALTANPVADLIRVFIGDGTPTNPHGGLLLGNGYSWTALTCASQSPCTGGNGGRIGNGGNG